MDQFLISRTSDSLNKRSVVETGRGARYLQDCLFLQICKSSPGLEPPPTSPGPGSPKINHWDYLKPCARYLIHLLIGWEIHAAAQGTLKLWFNCLVIDGKTFTHHSPNLRKFYILGVFYSAFPEYPAWSPPPQGPPGWASGCWESREQTLLGCRNILVKFLPVSKVSEGITFDFINSKELNPHGKLNTEWGTWAKALLICFLNDLVLILGHQKKNSKADIFHCILINCMCLFL